MLATDVSAPEMEALLCGRSVTLRFDHNAMRQSELYYKWSTQEVLGYYGIVDLATRRTYCGLGALRYGAAAAAECPYAAAVEFGSARAGAQPFMSPALEGAREAFLTGASARARAALE